ncbi:MAG TPA: pseudouridine synthase [Fibrella sp.]
MKRDKDNNDRRDGKGRPEGRRDDARGGFNKGGDRSGGRPSFGDRPRTGGSDRPSFGDKKPYNREGGDRDRNRPDSASGRPDGPRKPFNRDGDRPSYGDRKPFNRDGGPRDGGSDRPAYGDRKRDDRPDGPRKPFNREGGDRPAYGDRKPFSRDGGDRKRDDRSDAPRKPFNRDRDERPSYGDRKPFNKEGGSDRPAYGDRKPFNREGGRDGGSDRPAYGDRNRDDRPDGPRKPFNRDRDERPSYGDRDQNRTDSASDGPRKPFNRDGGPRDDRRDGDRPERKPFNRDDRPTRPREGDSARFDRRDRSEGSDERPERKPFTGGDRREGGAERPFERKPFTGGDRRDRDDNRGDDRPRFDRRNEGDEATERPERKQFEPRDPNGPARPRTTGDRKPFKRDRDDDDQNSEDKAIERRTGRYEKAPNYNLSTMRDNLPRSRKVAKNLDRERESDPNSIRLNRYIANAGVCSRREADELIAKGDVQVNGNVVTEMGYRVKPSDVVKYGNKVLNPEKMVYVLLNKPRDIITTTEDPEERHTVMDLIADAGPYRLYPVGRLDRNTTGLLLMTNDGELAGKLTHPSNNVKKVYQVELDKPITEEHFEAIRNGLDLEDGHIKPDDLAIITPDAQVVGVEIHSGRNRIVRRMFESLGYEVTKLDRTVFAGLTKKELPRGKWRFLEPKEVVKLKYLI